MFIIFLAVTEKTSILDDSHQLVIDTPQNGTTSKNEFGGNETLVMQTSSTTDNPIELHSPIMKGDENSTSAKRNNDDTTEPEKQLPTAAINLNMIDGQPVYSIQLNGLSIPIAAITIPTSDGPRHLQSAITTLPASATPKDSSFTDPSSCTDKNEEIQPPTPVVTSTPTSTKANTSISSGMYSLDN